MSWRKEELMEEERGEYGNAQLNQAEDICIDFTENRTVFKPSTQKERKESNISRVPMPLHLEDD